MLQVSDAYKELVESNIRPKCEPVIKVSGIDNTGKEINLIWNASNIKDLKYKRGVDVIGRELPFMELTWTEIYTGKLNAENYPEKYNNITNYMEVELSFVQDLSFYNTWKTLYKSGKTWKDIYSNNVTWKQLKSNIPQETITMPKLYLSARPTIKNQTITWVAKDILSFLEHTVSKMLYSGSDYPGHIAYIVDDISAYDENKYVKAAFEQSLKNIKNYSQENQEKIEFGDGATSVFYEGMYNDVVLQYANLKSYHIRYGIDGSFYLWPYHSLSSSEEKISSNILYDVPEISYGTNISSYSFESHSAELDEKSNYEVEYSEYLEIYGYYHYLFPRPSEVLDKYNPGGHHVSGIYDAITYIGIPLIVTPYTNNTRKNTLTNNATGETFEEKNPLNPFTSNSDGAKERLTKLNDYLKANRADISFSCLPILQYEPVDVIYVETNLYGEDGEKINKQVSIVSIEIQYNGAIKETIKAHEVNVGAG